MSRDIYAMAEQEIALLEELITVYMNLMSITEERNKLRAEVERLRAVHDAAAKIDAARDDLPQFDSLCDADWDDLTRAILATQTPGQEADQQP